MPITMNAIYGKYLGYPSCCVEAFGDVATFFALRPAETQKAALNGFLPCPSCAKKLLAKEITYEELINPNRQCTISFKVDMSDMDKSLVSQELQNL